MYIGRYRSPPVSYPSDSGLKLVDVITVVYLCLAYDGPCSADRILQEFILTRQTVYGDEMLQQSGCSAAQRLALPISPRKMLGSSGFYYSSGQSLDLLQILFILCYFNFSIKSWF